jgi:hypothetical protein
MALVGRMTRRPFSRGGNGTKGKPGDGIAPELLEFMHGRKNSERRDSITEGILKDRETHFSRIQNLPVNARLLKFVEDEGLGTKKRRNMVYASLPDHIQTASKNTLTGAGE